MRTIERLLGVYDADGTVVGEIGYVVGHLLGRRACALCDISHGVLRRRPAFDEAVASLGVPVEMLHRDEQPAGLAAVTQGELPCVVAEGDGECAVLLDRAALAACEGDPAVFAAAIRAVATERGLALRAA